MHAAEHDGVLGRLGGDARQRQRIAHVVGDVLDRGQLVVVREHGGAAQPGQPADLGRPLRIAFDAGITGGRVGNTRGHVLRERVHAIQNRHRGSFRAERFST